MANAFAHTLHALKREDTFWNKHSLLFIAVLIVLWMGWMFLGTLTLYKTSSSAWLEAHSGRISVDASVNAQIYRTHITLGQTVEQDDILIELNSRDLQLEQAELRAKTHQINAQMPVLYSSLEAERIAQREAQSASEKIHKSTHIRRRIAAEQVDFAKNKYTILGQLHADGHAAELEYLTTGTELKQAEAELQAYSLAISQIEAERIREQSSREARIARLQQEYTQFEEEKTVIQAASERLQHAIDQRQIKAPASGRISDVADLRTGAMIHQGQRFATIITDNPLHVVAEFPIGNALGRLQPHQAANLRLQVFPWIQYGMLQASVRAVDNESQTGKIRVELDIEHIPDTIIPQHGLTGQVEISVEEITPAALLFRMVGRHLTGDSALVTLANEP